MNDSVGKRVINVLLVCAAILFVVALIMYFGLYRDYVIAEGRMVSESWKGYGDSYWIAKARFDQIAGKRRAWLITAIASPVVCGVLMYIRGAFTKQSKTNINDGTKHE